MRQGTGRTERFDGLRRRWQATPLGYLGVRFMGFGTHPSPAQVEGVDRLISEAPTHVWLSLVPAMTALDVVDILPHLDVPTLVMVGDRDRLTPQGAAERIALAVRGAELAVIPDAGHMAPMERPHVFRARLREFLVGEFRRRGYICCTHDSHHDKRWVTSKVRFPVQEWEHKTTAVWEHRHAC